MKAPPQTTITGTRKLPVPRTTAIKKLNIQISVAPVKMVDE
jgi:hypothetical protein